MLEARQTICARIDASLAEPPHQNVLITLPNFLILSLCSIVFSTVLILIVRRSVKPDFLRLHHEVTDPVLAVLGTLFAILLGFMLANSMQRFETARDNIETEAGAVGNLYRLAGGVPEKYQGAIRSSCKTYLSEVIDHEWVLMQQDQTSDAAWNEVDELWKSCLAVRTQEPTQIENYNKLLDSMTTLGQSRRTRSAELKYKLPQTLWFIVIFGGLATISFTYFFAVESAKLQIAMTSVVTIMICLNLYMLAGYDDPFSGDIALTSQPFKTALKLIEKLDAKNRKDGTN